MELQRLPLNALITDKIGWARKWWEAYGDFIRSQETLIQMGKRFKEAARRSRQAMSETGMVEICRKCGQKGVSCCGAGLERHYTDVLLLINLFLGVELPDQRTDPRGCYFLGEKGCLLLARQVICINFLCPDLTFRTDPDQLAVLRRREGEETALLFALNEGFLRFLRQAPEREAHR